jgi:putative phosphoribosyl transferase
MNATKYRDRLDAGRALAKALRHYANHADVIVLALPRGGVPIGYEIARALRCPLDLVLVRKLGAPYQPELAVGAVVDGEPPEIVVNEDVASALDLPKAFIKRAADRELVEIARRRQLYLKDRPHPALGGKTAILVDDGIATGATARAALRAARRQKPARLVLAVPVAPPETVRELAAECDEVICLEQPLGFGAIGFFYADFRQVTDEEVIALLDRAAAEASPGG